MCDYSLHASRQRLAEEGERLIVNTFESGVKGLAGIAEHELDRLTWFERAVNALWSDTFRNPRHYLTAVCVPPGARLRLSGIPKDMQKVFGIWETELVELINLSLEPHRQIDGVRFNHSIRLPYRHLPDANVLSLQNLDCGIRVEVVALEVGEEQTFKGGPRRMSETKSRIIEWARVAIDQNHYVIDTETTGLDANAEIVEIAVVDVLETVEFSMLVKPSKPIPPASAAVHGITDETVKNATRWPGVLQIVDSIVGDWPVLAYNSDYGRRLVKQSSQIYNCKIPALADWGCLMLAWNDYHSLPRWAKLEDVCRQLEIPPGGHRALGDAKAAREVLRWLAGQEV